MRTLWKAVTAPFRRKTAPAAQPATRPEKAAKPGPTPGTVPGAGQRAKSRPGPVPARGRKLVYAPQLDGQADPGEIVWTWVEYEDDPSQGKDRPVLVVGRDRDQLLGLMLSSQSERDGQRGWLALGPGNWDREQRPSWIRLDRVLDVPEAGIRREGAVLDRSRFDQVARELRDNYGWA
ncbi:type II toxin-antitoxin system PemK/MazF family toxin [Longispora urticae]